MVPPLYPFGPLSRALTPSIATASPLTGGFVAVAYSQYLVAGGGLWPFTYAVTAGALPDGLALSAGGLLSGTPTVAAAFGFTVQVTDALGRTATKAFTVTVGLAARVAPDADDLGVWPLTEPFGSFANAGVGDGGDCALYEQGGITRGRPGPFGPAAGILSVLYPGNGYVNGLAAPLGSMEPATGLSMSCWIWMLGWGSAYAQQIVKHAHVSTWAAPWGHDLCADGPNPSTDGWSSSYMSVGGAGGVRSAANLTLNHWHHVGSTYDPLTGLISVYLDGVLTGTTVLPGNHDISYHDHGNWSFGTNMWNGYPNQVTNEYQADMRIARIARPAAYFAAVWNQRAAVYPDPATPSPV